MPIEPKPHILQYGAEIVAGSDQHFDTAHAGLILTFGPGVGAAIGCGGLPRWAPVYEGSAIARNDGRTVYLLTVHNVPVDGFWSISVYSRARYFGKNALDAYSVNWIFYG
jgi:hypothetical protein